MSSKSGCIVSQVHIPDYDVQGSLTAADKLHLVEFGIRHLREFNPNSYIILTGHGHRPDARYLDVCDYVYWENECLPLNTHGYVVGMPAQFKFVSYGLQQAKKMGFARCLKTRGDCIIGIPLITKYCDQILDSEQKSLLITQQTGDERLGDCFMYGDTDILGRTWHHNNPVFNQDDGLQNTAMNFRRATADFGPWKSLLNKTCAFRDVHKLKFTCLRWNYQALNKLDVKSSNDLFYVNYDFAPYHWGKANGWHHFDGNDNMTGSGTPLYWSQKQFYTGN